MKKLLSVSFCVCLVLISVNVFAQAIECIIEEHSTEAEQLKADIRKNLELGYIPEGLTYDGNHLYMMYLKEPDVTLTEWSLEWYNAQDELEKGLSDKMNAGFYPTAISAVKGQIFVFYTKEEGVSITAYSFAPVTWDTMEDDLAADIEEGFAPVGIAVMEDGQYFVLMVTMPGLEFDEWLVEHYEMGQHQQAIDDNIANGYIPVGFEAGDNWVHVLYLK